MTLIQQTSQVVSVRRRIDAIIDGIANEIAARRKRRSRKFITVFGSILMTLDEILHELESLQYRNQKEVPSEIRKKIIESRNIFHSAMLQEQFEELEKLL